MFVCHKCETEWVSEKKRPGFKEFCETCSAYLHCCKNCRFHNPSSHNGCVIHTTEPVGDPAGLNFCEEFEWSEPGEDKSKSERAESMNTFNDLFGGELKDTSKKPLSEFDDLFGE
jgi:hypothetical protein